jgi:hypothetical protein
MTNENGWKAREGKRTGEGIRERNRKMKNQRLKERNGWRNRKNKLDRGQKQGQVEEQEKKT